MKSIVIIFLCILFTGCGSVKTTKNTTSNDPNKLVLQPNVPSNKYSKTRQTKNN